MVDLTADCSRCDALCCVAMAFDEGEMFGFDKPAGTPCRHLKGKRCGIYETLEDESFAGCRQYDCLGAGQRVVQEMFQGQSWRDGGDISTDIFEAFRIMRLIHQWLELMEAAADLPLNSAKEAELETLYARLQLPDDYDLDTLIALERSGIGRDVQVYFRSLAEVVGR